jgi:hypothetical protein
MRNMKADEGEFLDTINKINMIFAPAKDSKAFQKKFIFGLFMSFMSLLSKIFSCLLHVFMISCFPVKNQPPFQSC